MDLGESRCFHNFIRIFCGIRIFCLFTYPWRWKWASSVNVLKNCRIFFQKMQKWTSKVNSLDFVTCVEGLLHFNFIGEYPHILRKSPEGRCFLQIKFLRQASYRFGWTSHHCFLNTWNIVFCSRNLLSTDNALLIVGHSASLFELLDQSVYRRSTWSSPAVEFSAKFALHLNHTSTLVCNVATHVWTTKSTSSLKSAS